jgi:tRNA modification GTPase
MHHLTILTKSDLLPPEKRIHVKHQAFNFAISAKTGDGLDTLITHIAARAREAAGNASDPAITRVRHRRELESAVRQLDAFLDQPDSPLELRAEDLRLAASALSRLTGRIDAENVLGEIFSRFCIGK